MLKIGYDAKRLFNNFTGLGNYSRTLLFNLSEYYPEHVYYLYTPKLVNNKETAFFQSRPNFEVRLPKQKVLANYWRSRGIKKDLKKDKIDLFHGLSHEIPIGLKDLNTPSFVTIHDLIFKFYPTHYPRIDRSIYEFKCKYACNHADCIIAISESTKRDIIHYYGVPEEKVNVIYQSCHERFKQEKSDLKIREILEKYQIPQDFLLYVGSLTQRKNLKGLLEAMAQLPSEEQIPLVVVGNGRTYKKQMVQLVHTLGLKHLVFWTDVQYKELPILYQASLAFVYPSFYEGFGLPVIEALFSKVPVITSNVSSMPEAAGPHSLLIDPEDSSSIADAISRLLNDSGLRENMTRRGYEFAQKFNPERLTKQMMDTYLSVV